jgi:hypothetical protein
MDKQQDSRNWAMKSKWSPFILNGRLTFLGIVGLVVTRGF